MNKRDTCEKCFLSFLSTIAYGFSRSLVEFQDLWKKSPIEVMGPEGEELKALNQIDEKGDTKEANKVQKDQWGNEIEFLLSCITLSVGLGNVWRYARVNLKIEENPILQKDSHSQRLRTAAALL